MDYDKPVTLVMHVPTGTSTPRERTSTGLTLAEAVRRIVEGSNPGMNRATTSIRCGAQKMSYEDIVAIHGRPDFPRG